MKFFCIFIIFLGHTNENGFNQALFTERFRWPSYTYEKTEVQQTNDISDKVQYSTFIQSVCSWKDKLFCSILKRSVCGMVQFSRIVFADLNNTEKSPPLKPYPKDKSYRILSTTNLEVDKCDRLWTFDYLNQTIIVIDLKQNKIIRQTKLHPKDTIHHHASIIVTEESKRINIDVNQSDCDDAYAYISNWSSLEILVYSFKRNKYWKTGKPDVSNGKDKNVNYTKISDLGIYPIPEAFSTFNDQENRTLILKPSNSECFIAASVDSLRNSENRTHFQYFTIPNHNTWLGQYYDKENSIVFYPSYEENRNNKFPRIYAEMGCWNVKRFPKPSANTSHIMKLPNAELKQTTVSRLGTGDQNTLWILTNECDTDGTCYDVLYSADVEELVTECDSVYVSSFPKYSIGPAIKTESQNLSFLQSGMNFVSHLTKKIIKLFHK